MYPILITIAGVFAVRVPIEHGNVIIGQGVLETVMGFARGIGTVGEIKGIEAGTDLTMNMVVDDESRRRMIVMMMMCWLCFMFDVVSIAVHLCQACNRQPACVQVMR